jgi:hypothetical protein
VEALALPALALPCARCAQLSAFVCTERFRVNANGGRLDVWLLYRCAGCGEVHKQRIERRVSTGALPRERLAAYRSDAPERVRACAFAAGRGAEVPHRVARPPLPAPAELSAAGGLAVRIAQPEPCGARWDRLLARELAWPRSRVAREAARGALRVNGGADLRRAVADRDELEMSLGA